MVHISCLVNKPSNKGVEIQTEIQDHVNSPVNCYRLITEVTFVLHFRDFDVAFDDKRPQNQERRYASSVDTVITLLNKKKIHSFTRNVLQKLFMLQKSPKLDSSDRCEAAMAFGLHFNSFSEWSNVFKLYLIFFIILSYMYSTSEVTRWLRFIYMYCQIIIIN